MANSAPPAPRPADRLARALQRAADRLGDPAMVRWVDRLVAGDDQHQVEADHHQAEAGEVRR